jgi:hypothetical protein
LEELQEYERDLEKAILNVHADELVKLIYNAICFSMDAPFHKIFLIRRQSLDVQSGPIATPITPSIQSRLAHHFRSLEQVERIHLYERLLNVPCSKAMAGILFEGCNLATPSGWRKSHTSSSDAAAQEPKANLNRLTKWRLILSCFARRKSSFVL